jgi:AraC-like DNA-binding protein
MGFTKPNRLFNNFNLETSNTTYSLVISEKLRVAIEENSIYKNPNLTLSQLASVLDISTKELSKFINDQYHMNFSEYINHHRIETVKKLLNNKEAQKFTLVALAEIVGFNSKSSFNATFKKMTGMTPSEYKKSQDKG